MTSGVCCSQDRSKIAYDRSYIWVNKGNAIKIVLRFASNKLPAVTPICRFKDGTSGSNGKSIVCVYKGEILQCVALR